MRKTMELLAPGGDAAAIKAAIVGGADAVYCGLDKFNARNRAKNVDFNDLTVLLHLAHQHDCSVFLTVNILIVESELSALINLLNKLVNSSLDGIIVQDPGVLYLLKHHFPSLKVHASTQMTTHNAGQIAFLKELTVKRVNLCRELNLKEIKNLTASAHENDISTEVFVHGSHCISFSGLCYLSSLHGGNSGNRGRCSQQCRDQYQTTEAGKAYPFNLKDNSAYAELPALADAGVDALKIEGRIKSYDYVFAVVKAWREQLERYDTQHQVENLSPTLYKVFNRGLSSGYLHGQIGSPMYIDNPRDHSARYHAQKQHRTDAASIENARDEINQFRAEVERDVSKRIEELNCTKLPLSIAVVGKADEPLKLTVSTPESSFVVQSDKPLRGVETGSKKASLSEDVLMTRLKVINETVYQLQSLDLTELDEAMHLPFSSLSALKKHILTELNNGKPPIPPVELPKLKQHQTKNNSPKLSILIDTIADIELCEQCDQIFFQLPDSIALHFENILKQLKTSPAVIPYFSAVLIGKDYAAALYLLDELQPQRIITNNTGIGFEAGKREIEWIAGPYLNLTNSYSLQCLKEEFNCAGAFISNELSRNQIGAIKAPEDFELCYSIYHPIMLMTSRQCLFQQVTGCEKETLDVECIPRCSKTTIITNTKNNHFIVEKSPGNYHRLFNHEKFLNLDIINDMPHRFDNYMIDMRSIVTETESGVNKQRLIKQFKTILTSDRSAAEELKKRLTPTTKTQYNKGI